MICGECDGVSDGDGCAQCGTTLCDECGIWWVTSRCVDDLLCLECWQERASS